MCRAACPPSPPQETAQSLAASMAQAEQQQQTAASSSSASSTSGEQEAIMDIPAIIVDPVEDREVGQPRPQLGVTSVTSRWAWTPT